MTSWIEHSVAWVFATVETDWFQRQHRHYEPMNHHPNSEPSIKMLDSWIATKRSVSDESPEGDGEEARTKDVQYPQLQSTKVV